MKIAWVHNYKYADFIGGAEISDEEWISKGKELGHEIQEITPTTGFIRGDFYVIGNYNKIPVEVLKKVVLKPYVHIIHLRPLEEPFADFYKNSRCLIFVSPKQKRKHQEIISGDKFFITPPFIDPGKFYDREKAREKNSYLYVGAIRTFKGIPQILRYSKRHPGSYYLYGPTKEREAFLVKDINKTKNCWYMGQVPYRQIPDLMNKYERFISLPPDDRFESFGRTAIEAILCGMETILNKKTIGAFSWNWDFSNPKKIAGQLKKHYHSFWDNLFKYL
jgi:glycosyltransferase involved in cell wall biosynthesis